MTTTIDFVRGRADDILKGNHLVRPPVSRDRWGRYKRADAGEWDGYYDLPESDRRYLRQHHLGGNVGIDEVATWHGLSIDETWQKIGEAIRDQRSRKIAKLDPLDDDFEGWSDYSDDMDFEHELLGPAEVAELLQVSLNAVTQNRRRYADFPEPVAILSSTRIWRRRDIVKWAKQHDRPLAED